MRHLHALPGYGDHPSLFDVPSEVVEPYVAVVQQRTNTDTTAMRNARDIVQSRGRKGVTWSELTVLTDTHHGTASAMLSTLHRAGEIARLTEKRHRSSVYVALEHVDGRPTAEHQPNAGHRLLAEVLDAIEADLAAHHYSTALARVRATKAAL